MKRSEISDSDLQGIGVLYPDSLQIFTGNYRARDGPAKAEAQRRPLEAREILAAYRRNRAWADREKVQEVLFHGEQAKAKRK